MLPKIFAERFEAARIRERSCVTKFPRLILSVRAALRRADRSRRSKGVSRTKSAKYRNCDRFVWLRRNH